MWKPHLWMQPAEPARGVKVSHRIHLKTWKIETAEGVVVVSLNWRTGEMVISIPERVAE
jgi:hypothetical protein